MEHTTLREARERAGLGLNELAVKSRVGKATISRLESGEITNPRYRTIRALERALRLPHGALMFGEPLPRSRRTQRRRATDRAERRQD